MSDTNMADALETAAAYLFNPVSLIVIAMICVVIFGIGGETKVDLAKEETKQVAMQLEIARLNAGITNNVEVK